MSRWTAVGTIIAGATVTVALTALTVVLLLLLGLVAAEVTGNWSLLRVFAASLALWATVGGATAGFFREDNRKWSAIRGSLAGALGIAVIGVIFGLVFSVILLGMTPAHGQEVDSSKSILTMVALGGGSGFITGAIFGAVGAVGVGVCRQELGR